MSRLSYALAGMLGLLWGWTLVTQSTTPVFAQMEEHGVQQSGGAAATSEAAGEPDTSEVQERGLRQLAPRVGDTLPPTVVVTGFKCSPSTFRCRCSGAADCKYMKDLMQSCQTHTCTGSGENMKCCCVMGQGTCTP